MALNVQVDSENVSCNGGSDGFAEAIVTGGTAPYEYLWSNFDNSSFTNNLSQGVINVTITDENGCTAIGGVTIQYIFYYVFYKHKLPWWR